MMLEQGQGRTAGDMYEKGQIKEYMQGQSKGAYTLCQLAQIFKVLAAKSAACEVP